MTLRKTGLLRNHITARLAPIFILMASTQSHAAVLEEITVTAQKREQSMQDIGVSVTAFTGDQVRELGFTNTTDIVNFTPGLNFTAPNAEGSQINFFLRGVGLNDFTDVNENPVATYFDEVYRGAMGGLSLQLFDIARVEVLRGPQGTLYGRNSTGGLVHFISEKPSEDFQAYAQLDGGSYDQVKFEGAIGGALGETVFARASVATNKSSGYTENRHVGVDDFNETDAVAGRLQLLWKASDAVDVLLKGHYSKNDAQVGAWQHETVVATENGDNRRFVGPDEDLYGAGPGNDAFGYRDTDNDPFAGNYDRDGKVMVKADGGSAHIDWEISDTLNLVSISAYDHTDRLQEEDTEAGPNPLLNPTFAAETYQWTQELRLQGGNDASKWVTGLYYYQQDVDGAYDLDLTGLGFVFFNANYFQEAESWSAFGQYEYEFAPRWSIVAGLRYTEETKEVDYRNVEMTGLYTAVTNGDIPPEAFGLDAAPPLTSYRPRPKDAFLFSKSSVGSLAEHDESNITGKLEIDFRPNDDWLWYAAYSRGVKSAGFNNGFLDATFIFASNTVDTIAFDDETLHAFETGFKSTLLDGRARFNASAFYYDYKDFQTFRFEILNAIIFNTDAEVYGGELELQMSPGEGWDIAAGLSLLDATAMDIPAIATGTLQDRTMVAAPDVSFNGLIRYETPAFGGIMAGLVKFKYQGETYYDIQNFDTSRENGFWLADLRLQWTSPDSHWELAAYVNNATDEEYRSYTFDFASFGFNQASYGRPRWYGGSIRYQF